MREEGRERERDREGGERERKREREEEEEEEEISQGSKHPRYSLSSLPFQELLGCRHHERDGC